MSVEALLDAYGKQIVDDVRASYNTKQAQKAKGPFNQNSRLAASMKYEIRQSIDSIEMVFIMDSSYIWVDGGRKPGKVSREGRASIERWIKRRGLTPKLSKLRTQKIKSAKNKTVKKAFKQASIESKIKSLAFVIARKITKEGYKPTHFYSLIIKDGREERLKKQIRTEVKKDLKIFFETK